MTTKNKVSEFFSLLPHQRNLVTRFFTEPLARSVIVDWDHGYGKTVASAHLILRFLEEQPSSRILSLAPSREERDQMQNFFTSLGIKSEVVDRMRYREMQDTTLSNQAMWSEGTVYLLTSEFATQEDISASLCAVPWSLLVVDEVERQRGQFENVIHALVKSSPIVRVLFLTVRCTSDFSDFGIHPSIVISHRLNDVVELKNDDNYGLERATIDIVGYEFETSERRLKNAASKIQQLLQSNDNTSIDEMDVFLSRFNSSFFAFEEAVLQLRNRLVHNDDRDRDISENLPLNKPTLLLALFECLAEIDQLSVDSKLRSLIKLFEQADPPNSLRQSTCIFVEYKATQIYLETALQEIGITPFVLKTPFSSTNLTETLTIFRENGGVLIFTMALMQGLELPNVDNLILYDLPRGKIQKQILYGRFNRIGRTKPLKITVFLEGTTDCEKSFDTKKELKEIFT